MPHPLALLPEDLRWTCDSARFSFANTLDMDPLTDVIGQKRAIRAIEFGLNMKGSGYNIFVTGDEGCGKSTITRDLTRRHAESLPVPKDWCLVNNFEDEYHPRPLSLPPGTAGRFAKQMSILVEGLRTALPKAFEDEAFVERQNGIRKEFSQKQQELFEEMDKAGREKNIAVSRVKTGYQTLPLKDGKPITHEEFTALGEEEKKQIQENVEEVKEKIEATLRKAAKIENDLRKAVEKISEELTLKVVRHRLDAVKGQYSGEEDVAAYLRDVEEDIIENVGTFVSREAGGSPEDPRAGGNRSFFQRYRVNVLAQQRSASGAPVVFETNPTYHNVFGKIEKRAFMGTMITDFTMVQAGSLLKANGGYLIMEVDSVLMNPYVWEALKRALSNKQLFIEDVSENMGLGVSSLRPLPIDLSVKVILIGDFYTFQVLQSNDAKFNKTFQVRADFDNEVERTDETVMQYAAFVARVCNAESLLPFLPAAVCRIVEYAQTYVSKKNKLSLRFGRILPVLKEADYWARRQKAEFVDAGHVEKAIEERRFRYNLYEARVHESYADESILMTCDGAETGQVNALAVYQVGDFSFGRPSRITAEVYMGKRGIVNIERESKLSGKTHDKGVLILSGCLGRLFAQTQPLSLSISITFEQSYGGIDGDSASSTELYAILSSLAGLPIFQGIAVTGSVNQKGEIQAIGGANQKIEGFFDVCKTKGLTGKQGVMIPEANVKNLMLRKDVVKAVEEGKFSIYRVATVEQGIEILTGVPAGTADKKGSYPKDTVYGRVQRRLKDYLKRSMELKAKAKLDQE